MNRPSAKVLLVLCLALLLASCGGYYFPNVYDGPEVAIYMPTWKNRTDRLGMPLIETVTGPDLHTILIGADGISADRLAPTAHAVMGLGAPLAVILPESVDLGIEAAAVWTYPRGLSELLSPIITAVPLELLAHSLAATLDRHPFDYDNPARRLISEKTIYRDGESAQAISRRYQPGTQ